jgi:hypothetical protein
MFRLRRHRGTGFWGFHYQRNVDAQRGELHRSRELGANLVILTVHQLTLTPIRLKLCLELAGAESRILKDCGHAMAKPLAAIVLSVLKSFRENWLFRARCAFVNQSEPLAALAHCCGGSTSPTSL